MGRIPSTVRLTRGEGLVARFGAVVLYLSGETSSTERILGAVEAAAGAADPGVAIAQRLAAAIFSSGSAQSPSFGVVAPTSGGLLILLRGPVRAVIDGPEGARELSGDRAMTWADEIVRDPVRRITVSTDGTAAEVAHTDLRSGIVPSGGFVMHAPPTGLTDRRRAATPKSAAPQPTDSTKRTPLPTPSHTRFTQPDDNSAPPRKPGHTSPGTPLAGTSMDTPRRDPAADTGASPREKPTETPRAESSSLPPGGDTSAAPRVDESSGFARDHTPADGPQTGRHSGLSHGQTPADTSAGQSSDGPSGHEPAGAPPAGSPEPSRAYTPAGRPRAEKSELPPGGLPAGAPQSGHSAALPHGETPSDTPHSGRSSEIGRREVSSEPLGPLDRTTPNPAGTTPVDRGLDETRAADWGRRASSLSKRTAETIPAPGSSAASDYHAPGEARSGGPSTTRGEAGAAMDDDAVANARTERSADWATEKLEPSTPVPEETPPATVLFEKQAGAASGGGERANVVEPQPTQAFDARAAALDEAAEQAESRDDDIPATAAFDAQAAASADADSSESEAVARAGKRWPGGKSGESASAAPGIGPPVVGRPGRDSTTVARPPGVLTAAGGTTYPLDRAYVIGRDPLTDEAVQKAKASPILLSGDRHISRIHARVFIEGAAVFVQDSSTPGGTYVAPPGASDWTRLGAQRFELKPGWSLRIGDRILTYSTGPGRARR